MGLLPASWPNLILLDANAVLTVSQGASFVRIHVTYVQQMRLYYGQGHTWVLDTATSRVCLMSQRADGRLVLQTPFSVPTSGEQVSHVHSTGRN